MNQTSRVASVLMLNASIQILVSTILGFIMLIPMQPWGQDMGSYFPSMHAMLAVHLDWYMLAFMEFSCAVLFIFHPSIASSNISRALMFGGWVNPMAYLLRDIGIDAFVIGGDIRQMTAALISGLSATCILVSWIVIVGRLYQTVFIENDEKREAKQKSK
jgi:hypothetical protein